MQCSSGIPMREQRGIIRPGQARQSSKNWLLFLQDPSQWHIGCRVSQLPRWRNVTPRPTWGVSVPGVGPGIHFPAHFSDGSSGQHTSHLSCVGVPCRLPKDALSLIRADPKMLNSLSPSALSDHPDWPHGLRSSALFTYEIFNSLMHVPPPPSSSATMHREPKAGLAHENQDKTLNAGAYSHDFHQLPHSAEGPHLPQSPLGCM